MLQETEDRFLLANRATRSVVPGKAIEQAAMSVSPIARAIARHLIENILYLRGECVSHVGGTLVAELVGVQGRRQVSLGRVVVVNRLTESTGSLTISLRSQAPMDQVCRTREGKNKNENEKEKTSVVSHGSFQLSLAW
jgi:hypothetical protein